MEEERLAKSGDEGVCVKGIYKGGWCKRIKELQERRGLELSGE